MIQAGVAGFKCFLIHSGVEEFPHVTGCDLHAAMEQLRGTGSVLLVGACSAAVLMIKSTRSTVTQLFCSASCSFTQRWTFSRQQRKTAVNDYSAAHSASFLCHILCIQTLKLKFMFELAKINLKVTTVMIFLTLETC